jgi:hypothetical protein
MRKFCRRKVRPINPDPVAWVLKGLQPLVQVDDDGANVLVRTQLKNHSALEAIRVGAGTRVHVDMLIGAANMTAALIKLYNRGSDYADEVQQFRNGVFSLVQRGAATNKFIFTGPELSAVNFGMQVHDAQLDITTVGELEAAIYHVRNIQRTGRDRRVILKEPA